MVPENAAVRRFQPDVVFNSLKLRQTCVFILVMKFWEKLLAFVPW